MTHSPTDSEKSKALKYLRDYEIPMMIQSKQILDQFGSMLSPPIQNALLETHLLHARNLIELFQRPSADRINIKDFGYKKITQFGNLYKRITKKLSHLTWSSIRGKKARWPRKEMLSLYKRLKDFITFLSVSDFDGTWDDTLSSINEEIERISP